MVRLVALVWFAFKAWMFYDAVRRRAAERWFWMIPFVPGGAVYYFFAVKLRDPGVAMLKQRMLDQMKRPPSVKELEMAFARTPSFANRVMLAQGLHDAGRYDEALKLFIEALDERPGDKDCLYGVGLCRLELKDAAGAVEPLTELVEAHPSYRDYAAWPDLAEALWYSNQREACHVLLADLVKASPRIRHYVLQAQWLKKAGRLGEAKHALETAIHEEQHQPKHVQRNNRPWVREASSLLDEMAR